MFSIHHVSLSVKNLEKSIRFYSVLGFKKVFHWQDEQSEKHLVHMKLEDFILELFCFKESICSQVRNDDPIKDLSSIGLKHFALKTPSIEKTKTYLIDCSIISEATIQKGRSGIDYFFVQDPDGNFIEIVQDDRVFS